MASENNEEIPGSTAAAKENSIPIDISKKPQEELASERYSVISKLQNEEPFSTNDFKDLFALLVAQKTKSGSSSQETALLPLKVKYGEVEVSSDLSAMIEHVPSSIVKSLFNTAGTIIEPFRNLLVKTDEFKWKQFSRDLVIVDSKVKLETLVGQNVEVLS